MEKLRTLNVVVFDYDGTVINSTMESYKIVREAVVKFGLFPPAEERIRQYAGMSWDKMFWHLSRESGWQPGKHEKICKLAQEKALTYNFPVFPGLIDKLSCLKDQGVKLVINTARTAESLIASAHHCGVPLELFDLIKADSKKDKPVVFDEIANYFQVKDFSSMIMIGDTVHYDYFPAKRHEPEITFFGVVSGAASVDDFMFAGLAAPQIVRNPVEAFAILKEWQDGKEKFAESSAVFN